MKSRRLTVKNNRGIGSDEHGTGTSTSSGTSSALRIDSNIATDYNSITAIPRARFNPVDGIEEGSCTAVAGVLRVNTLDVEVARLGEQVHERGLHAFGFVDDGFSANINTADRFWVNIVLFEEARNSF